MNAQLILDGKTYDIKLNEKEINKLVPRTGYERANTYYSIMGSGAIGCHEDFENNPYYDNANYYSDKEIAEHAHRADTLMRRIRRFAAEQNTAPDKTGRKYFISYDMSKKRLFVDFNTEIFPTFSPLFSSRKAAENAIAAFKDELIWYFSKCRVRGL